MTKQTQNLKNEDASEQETEVFNTEQEYCLVLNPDFTVSGSLLYGVVYDGQLHHNFTMRLPNMEDSLNKSDGDDWSTQLLGLYSQSLISLGAIPAEVLTFEFLKKELSGPELDVFMAAQEFLRKKRRKGTQN